MEQSRYTYELYSNQPGPTILILGGTHGDEKPGIEVVARLLKLLFKVDDWLSCKRAARHEETIQGRIILGFGNPEAMQLNNGQGQRGTDNNQRDLNRCFIPEELDRDENGTIDEQRAKELTPLLKEVDFMLDLHCTTGQSEGFACFGGRDTDRHALIYNQLPIRHILTDPSIPPVLGQPFDLPVLGTTDDYVNNHGGGDWTRQNYANAVGGAGLCYESAKEGETYNVESMFESTIRVLHNVGVIGQDFLDKYKLEVVRLKSSPPRRVFQLRFCHMIDEPDFASFEYAPGMQKNWLQVARNQVLGKYSSCHRSDSNVYIPCDGFLVFPKSPNKIRRIGDSLFYIAVEVKE